MPIFCRQNAKWSLAWNKTKKRSTMIARVRHFRLLCSCFRRLNEKDISRVRYLMSTITNVSASFSFFVPFAGQRPKKKSFLSAGAEYLAMMLHNELCENLFFISLFFLLWCLLISLVASYDAFAEDKCSLEDDIMIIRRHCRLLIIASEWDFVAWLNGRKNE